MDGTVEPSNSPELMFSEKEKNLFSFAVGDIEDLAANTIQRTLRSLWMKKRWHKLVREVQQSDLSRPEQLRIKRVSEILETERNFYHILNLVQQKYIAPIQRSDRFPKPESTDIFNHWETVLSLSEKLMEQLESQWGKWPCVPFGVGDIFIKMAPFFRNYTYFISNYTHALKLLAKLKKNKPIRDWFTRVAEDPVFEGKDLTACFIAPVQRLPRYVLLLQDLLKATPEYHVEYKPLVEAVRCIKETADLVNTKVKLAEQVTEIFRIQGKLRGENVPNLISPHRRFIAEGEVQSICDTQQNCYLILFNDVLLVGTKSSGSSKPFNLRGGSSGKIKVQKAISMFNAVVQPTPDVPPTFINSFLCASEEVMYFSCDDAALRDGWVRNIKEATDTLDEGFINEFSDDFHTLLNRKKLQGKLAIYHPTPDQSDLSILPWYYSLCGVEEKYIFKIFPTLDKPEVSLPLRKYRLRFLADREAKRKYCFELKEEGKQIIWFGATSGDDFDRWIAHLIPLCKHPAQDEIIKRCSTDGVGGNDNSL